MQFWKIFVKIAKRTDCILTRLNLVDKQKSFAWNNRNSRRNAQHLTCLLYIDIFRKELLEFGLFLKVNFQKMSKLITELSNGRRFANLSRTSN